MAETTKTILGMGNPLLDISVTTDQSLFDKYNVKPATACLAEEEHLPLFKEILEFDDVTFIAGGATQNSIRCAEWLSSVKGKTHFIGCVGDDENGKILAKAAADSGVQTHYNISTDTRTGSCAVLVLDKERALIADLGAANKYDHQHFLSEEIQNIVHSADIFYSAGFFLTVSPVTMQAVGKYAAETNKIFLMNVSAEFICNFFWEQIESCLPYADYLFGNETEAVAFGKKIDMEGATLQEIALKAANLPKVNEARPRIVIWTQGSNNVICAISGEEQTKEFPIIKLDASQIVDTNGAGDAFVGGFLAGLAADKSLEECVRAGVYTSSVILQTSGTQFFQDPEFNWS